LVKLKCYDQTNWQSSRTSNPFESTIIQFAINQTYLTRDGIAAHDVLAETVLREKWGIPTISWMAPIICFVLEGQLAPQVYACV